MTYPKDYKSMPDKTSDTYERMSTGQGEVVIWERQLMKGFFRRKVIGTQKITNYGVYDQFGHVIYLHQLQDVVILDSHGRSDSQFMGTSSSSRGSRVGYGMGRSRSQVVANVSFIRDGIPEITFNDVPSPQGLKQLVLAAKKALID